MKQNSILLAICLCCFLKTPAQMHKPKNLSIAITTLHTAFPFGSFSELFTKDYHPGFEISNSRNWKTKPRHDWFHTTAFGYSYHRFVQHSIVFYKETGYRYKFLKTFSAEAKVGAGYLHAIPVGKVYKLQAEGTYKKKINLGRPQGMASFSLDINKRIAKSGLSVFLEYQQRIQFPFIKSYVPLLPSNVMMVGVTVPFKTK